MVGSGILGGMVPPQELDLEKAVIGAMLIEHMAYFRVSSMIKDEVFYNEQHRMVFSAIAKMHQQNKTVDTLTLAAFMKSQGTLEAAGGNFAIVNLTTGVASAANIEEHVMVLLECYLRREMIKTCYDAIGRAYDRTHDIFDLYDEVSADLYKNVSHNAGKQAVIFFDVVKERLKHYEQPVVNGLTGIDTGFKSINRITGGWQNTDLTIIAGRPAMGKTAFVLNLARNAAVGHGVPVAIFSLEMSREQLVDRMISSETEIYHHRLTRTRDLADWEWNKIHNASSLIDSKIWIDDTASLTVQAFRSKATRLKHTQDIQLIIIDYLQLMRGGRESGGNREQEIGTISRGVKAVAKDLNVPILMLSQLSRAVESRPGANGKRPMLSDLRESGSIEQDADQVVFLYRPEYYGVTEDEQGRSLAGLAEIIFAKNRHGEVDTAVASFKGALMKFTDLEDLYPEASSAPAPSYTQAAMNLQPNLKFDKDIIIKPSNPGDFDPNDRPF